MHVNNWDYPKILGSIYSMVSKLGAFYIFILKIYFSIICKKGRKCLDGLVLTHICAPFFIDVNFLHFPSYTHMWMIFNMFFIWFNPTLWRKKIFCHLNKLSCDKTIMYIFLKQLAETSNCGFDCVKSWF